MRIWTLLSVVLLCSTSVNAAGLDLSEVSKASKKLSGDITKIETGLTNFTNHAQSPNPKVNELVVDLDEIKKALKDKAKIIQSGNELRDALRDVYGDIRQEGFKETLTKTDWIQLKDDCAEIQGAVKIVITKLNDITTLLKVVPGELKKGIGGLTVDQEVILDLLGLQQELVSLMSNLVDSKISLSEAYSIANNMIIERMGRELEGAEFARKTADAFETPKVDAIELSLGDAGEVYFEAKDVQGKYVIDENIKTTEHTKGSYSRIDGFDFEVHNFELSTPDGVRIQGDGGLGKVKFHVFTKFKWHPFVGSLSGAFTSDIYPYLTIEEVVDKNLAIKGYRRVRSDKNLTYGTDDTEDYTKSDKKITKDELRKEYAGDRFYIIKGDSNTVSVYNHCCDEVFRIQNLFNAKALASNYETSRIIDGTYTISSSHHPKIQVYGPSSALLSTIEVGRNTSIGGTKGLDKNVNNATELRLNLEATDHVMKRGVKSGWGEWLSLRYVKVGSNLNYLGNLTRLDSLSSKDLRPGEIDSVLVNTFSENTRSRLYATLPFITWRRASGSTLDAVISGSVFQDNIKVPGQGKFERNNVGARVAADYQDYGKINFRILAGVDWRNTSLKIRTESVTNTATGEAGTQVEVTSSNKKGVFKGPRYGFVEVHSNNLSGVFLKFGYHKLLNAKDVATDGLGSEDEKAFYLSINYRINPVDVFTVTRKVLLGSAM